MGNELPDKVTTGTIGEILCQLRLLEFGVQAAPPIKDSGNDLIAVKGEVVKYIQVKTSAVGVPKMRGLPEVYHLVFLVKLESDDVGALLLDQSSVSVVLKDNGAESGRPLTQDLVNELWGE